MFGPYTPTLLALLTRSGLLSLPKVGRSSVSFKGKVACVTGGATGIGAAIATQAVREGCRAVVLADISFASGSSRTELHASHPFISELESRGAEVLALNVDVSKKSESEKLRDACVASFGTAHLLFLNAGVGMPGVLSATDEALQRSMDINLNSVLWGMRAFVPIMEENNDDCCRIVNTASLAGLSEATGLYGVTKHAVVAATEAVASELAWRKSNVGVSVVRIHFVTNSASLYCYYTHGFVCCTLCFVMPRHKSSGLGLS